MSVPVRVAGVEMRGFADASCAIRFGSASSEGCSEVLIRVHGAHLDPTDLGVSDSGIAHKKSHSSGRATTGDCADRHGEHLYKGCLAFRTSSRRSFEPRTRSLGSAGMRSPIAQLAERPLRGVRVVGFGCGTVDMVG
jgi:hypothetical protein